MAVIRIAYTGGDWKKMILQMLLCGALTLTFASALDSSISPKRNRSSSAAVSGLSAWMLSALSHFALLIIDPELMMTTGNSGSRGIRNNNPGNIRWGDDWRGLVTAVQRTDKSFCQFTKPEYGIRAMIIILRNYQKKHGLNTISGIIHRWAPTVENDMPSYIGSVSKSTGVPADKRIDTTDSRFMTRLLQAIINHENGRQPYGFDVFIRAFALAGV